MTTIKPGTQLGHYDVLERIGAGGMGEVFRARDTKLGRNVAIKVLPDVFALNPDRVLRFKREAQALASINHPNIGQIYGLEESGQTRWIVMEFVGGETLADKFKLGPLAVGESVRIGTQIAEALDAAHEKGII